MTLNTETNTPAMEQRILKAARRRFHTRNVQADFEHGQWWITIFRTRAQYSVNDCEGPETLCTNGFDFECVTRGDDQ